MVTNEQIWQKLEQIHEDLTRLAGITTSLAHLNGAILWKVASPEECNLALASMEKGQAKIIELLMNNLKAKSPLNDLGS